MTAIIFDMDGLLIDSEPLWHEAEKAVFSTVGLRLTTADCLKTTGLRVDEVVRFWRPTLSPETQHVLAERIVDNVILLIQTRGVAKPGVTEALRAAATYPRALASSSAMRIIRAVLERLNIVDTFSVIHSAEHEAFGKPHPAVYLTTARLLGIAPERCIAVEDSPNGVRSAKSAGMRCIAVPDAPLMGDPRFVEADRVLPSLTALDAKLLAELAST